MDHRRTDRRHASPPSGRGGAVDLRSVPRRAVAATLPGLVAAVLVLLGSPATLDAQTPEQRYFDWARLPFPTLELQARRASLIQELADTGGGIFLTASVEGTSDGETFRQNDDFWYLKNLEGVGAVKAKAIVDYRSKHGNFKTLDDLTQVPGIGEATVEKNRGNLSLKNSKSKKASASKTDNKKESKKDGKQ